MGGGGRSGARRGEAKGTTERVVSRNLVKSRTLAVLASLNAREHLSECRVHPYEFKGWIARVRSPLRMGEGGREGGGQIRCMKGLLENYHQLIERARQ